MSRLKRYFTFLFPHLENLRLLNPEQIDAQIIVDMTFAINKNPKWHQNLDFDESKLTQADQRETQLAPFCMHSKHNEGC
jgi:hypothetical protein